MWVLESNLGHQACWQVPFSTEPSQQPTPPPKLEKRFMGETGREEKRNQYILYENTFSIK